MYTAIGALVVAPEGVRRACPLRVLDKIFEQAGERRVSLRNI